MRMNVILPGAALAIVLAVPAIAAPAAKAPEKTTCREFVDLDETVKPQVVSYTIGYDSAKKTHVALVTTEDVAKIVPVVVDSCQTRPTETILDRVRAYWNKL